MTTQVSKKPVRVITTTKLLVEMFKHIPKDVARVLLTPFTYPPGQVERAFQEIITGIEVNEPRSIARETAISAIQDLCNAYTKMTIFERVSVRKGLLVYWASGKY